MPSLNLPLGNVDLKIQSLGGDVLRVSWLDALLGEVVEAQATLAQLAQWQRDGGLPADVPLVRWTPDEIDDQILAVRVRQHELRDELREQRGGRE